MLLKFFQLARGQSTRLLQELMQTATRQLLARRGTQQAVVISGVAIVYDQRFVVDRRVLL